MAVADGFLAGGRSIDGIDWQSCCKPWKARHFSYFDFDEKIGDQRATIGERDDSLLAVKIWRIAEIGSLALWICLNKLHELENHSTFA